MKVEAQRRTSALQTAKRLLVAAALALGAGLSQPAQAADADNPIVVASAEAEFPPEAGRAPAIQIVHGLDAATCKALPQYCRAQAAKPAAALSAEQAAVPAAAAEPAEVAKVEVAADESAAAEAPVPAEPETEGVSIDARVVVLSDKALKALQRPAGEAKAHKSGKVASDRDRARILRTMLLSGDAQVLESQELTTREGRAVGFEAEGALPGAKVVRYAADVTLASHATFDGRVHLEADAQVKLASPGVDPAPLNLSENLEVENGGLVLLTSASPRGPPPARKGLHLRLRRKAPAKPHFALAVMPTILERPAPASVGGPPEVMLAALGLVPDAVKQAGPTAAPARKDLPHRLLSFVRHVFKPMEAFRDAVTKVASRNDKPKAMLADNGAAMASHAALMSR
jgi:hypothetical protein